MWTKSIILLICALLLLQTTHAIPQRMRREAAAAEGGDVAVEQPKQANSLAADTSDSAESSEEFQDVKIPRQKLMTTTLLDLISLAKYVNEHGPPLFRKALTQLEALPEKSEALQANITRIADFLKNNPENTDVAKEEGIMALFESMINFTNIMEEVDNMPAELEQTKTLQKAFSDNGSAKFEEDLMAELKLVTAKFEKAIESYLNVLSSKQKENETKLINWYTKFTNEKDDEKKAQYYASFFDTFRPGE